MPDIIPVLRVGAIGDPRVSDGRLIPFLTFAAGVNADLERAVEVHNSADPPGDVISTWGWRKFDRSNAFLKLDFIRPVPVTVLFGFALGARGYVVDWVRAVNGLYLQSAQYGDSVSQGWGKPAMLVEISSESTFPLWENMYQGALVKKFKASGLSKRQAVAATKEYRQRQREMWFRRKLSIEE